MRAGPFFLPAARFSAWFQSFAGFSGGAMAAAAFTF
jgi:hypothetical protein